MDINELVQLLNRGYSGWQLTALHAGRTDSLLEDLFLATGSGPGLCLIGVGGYGRGELAPYSDIDIMLFAKDKSESARATGFLYKLWDAKLDIGHSFRTPSDCINEAKRDIRTRTALLENRYISGDRDLYRYFVDNVYPEIAYRGAKDFISGKLRESELRHKGPGHSVFMLEPHIKEGKGGLRDIHTILWLAGVKLRNRHFDGLATVLPPEDFERFRKAYDFMIKVRFCLHLLSGRRNDILSFEFHDRVAEMLHFKASEKFLASERFMRYLYLKASVINGTSARLLDMFSTPFGISTAAHDADVQPFYFLKKKITDDFYILRHRIIAREGLSGSSPVKIIEAFYVMSITGKLFSQRLRAEIRKNLFRINRATRNSSAAVRFFMDIVRGERVYETLREMHYCGVLGRFIPEFGALSFLVVYEPYHRFTVDEHTLHALGKLEALRNTKYKSLEHLSAIFMRIVYRETLVLSLLLHDIGKRSAGLNDRYAAGRGHHEEIGYKGLKNIIERFNLSVDLRSSIEFLVKNHTLMSSFAFKGDIDNPEVISQFADEVGSKGNLDALYLLTYADMASVGPDFWSDWKAYLLKELYEATSGYLEKAHEKLEVAAVFSRCSPEEKAGVEHFLSFMPERYIISTPSDKISVDYEVYKGVFSDGFAIKTNESAGGTAEITIGAWDMPGLFLRIIGVLSSMGMNIFRARLYTGKNGIVMDRVQISNWRDLWWDGIQQLLEGNLRKAVFDNSFIKTLSEREKDKNLQRDFGEPVAAGIHGNQLSAAPAGAVRFEPFIEFDNETSAKNSIIEFFAQDRIGLLYDAASLMHEKGIDIISARINTEAGLANDIFYLQKDGLKIGGQAAHEVLLALWERLNLKRR